MEKFIQEYLSIYYKLGYSQIGNAGVYDIYKNPKYKAPESSKKILKEISEVFFLNEEDAKNQVELWAITVDPEINLGFYWKTINELFFPSVSRVHAADAFHHSILNSYTGRTDIY